MLRTILALSLSTGLSALAGVAASTGTGALAEAPQGYYRFPAIRGDRIVFAAEGDLWKTNIQGGLATRLTSHTDEERHPAISPDGHLVAFTGEYEEPDEVYTIPIQGGLPIRRTFEGRRAGVVGFTPEGRLLYATRKFSTLPNAQLVELDLTDNSHRVLPLSQAADGCYSDDGRTLFFTRFARQGSHTKRYKGGTAQDIWSFTEGQTEAVALTPDYPGTSSTPMCGERRVFFISDRDDTMNIWSMLPDGTGLVQHTHHDGWDVKSPDLDNGRIVYQLGADLWLHDIASGDDRRLDIRLASDFDQMRERWIEEPADYLTAHHPSPDGDRVALTARGEVFVAPVEDGRLVQVTRRGGVRYRQARFLPDGKSLVVLSDETGEVEWWKLPADGIGAPSRITDDGKVLRFNGVPSPDGRWLVHHDHDQELWLTDLVDATSKKIDFSPYWGYGGITWSPDSRFVAYDRDGDNQLARVFVFDVTSDSGDTSRAITSPRFESYSPSFSHDGKWLYFLSDRTFRTIVGSPWGDYQPEPYFDRPTKIYQVALVPGLRSPFRPADELHEEEEEEDDDDGSAGRAGGKKDTRKKGGKDLKGDKSKKDGDEDAVEVTIDFDGIQNRVVELPVDRANLSSLWAGKKHLFWIDNGPAGDRERTLKALEIGSDGDDPEVLVNDIESFEPTLNGKRLLVRKGSQLHMIKADSSKPDLDETTVDLSEWSFPMNPREEWRQMFIESWRLERDYFYDREMHGVDWTAMLQKYLPLVDRVTNRGELSDLQGQMAGELSALHTFVRGGDHRDGDDDVDPGSLGAVLVRDEAAGGYRVAHIYQSDPALPEELAPLSRPGVDVREGDVIVSINGVATLSVTDPAALLRNQADRQVRLRVTPGGSEKPRDVIVTPFSPGDEDNLRYDEWEYTRRLQVEQASDSTIGYVHLRAMGGGNISTWYRDFFPVFQRQGLIIDVRHNRGGNIDAWILEKLLRRAWFYWQPRVGKPYWNMHFAFRGHLVVLVNESTASDGEAFAEGFRRLGLGKLIGTRTWGGEIWLTGSNVLVDEGIVTAAEFGVYGPAGDWLIEGHGVEPDIVVDNLPHETFGGRDAQLEAAIAHLERLIRDDPRPVPPVPRYPDKSKP